MEKIVLGSQMKKVDGYTIDKMQIPSLVLMERAAFSVYEEIIKFCDCTGKILVVCGTGNNGGDGLAISRMLCLSDYRVCVYIIGNMDSATPEFRKQYEIIKNIQVDIVDDWVPEEYTVIVDALFGVGLSRDVKDKFFQCISQINKSDAMKISVDVPSGLCADTGKIMGISVKADYTVTFGRKKAGLLINQGIDYSGKILVKNIGFPKEAYNQADTYYACEEKDLEILPKRNENSNKGTYGKLLVIAGQENMAGAAYFSAKAAYRVGTGLVQILSAPENREILQIKIPEAVLVTYDTIDKCMEEAGVIVIGPGLGVNNKAVTLVEKALKEKKNIVLDADALNVIAKNPNLYSYFHDKVIVTPHLGEMSRLTNITVSEIKDHLIQVCDSFADKYGITCILKDSGSIISNGKKVYINTSGNSGMASAGSGDVLTGVIGGLLSIGMTNDLAAVMGAYIHGLAGDIMAAGLGKNALMASDIIDGLIPAMRKE